MFGDEMKQIYQAAGKMLADQLQSQIDDSRAAIASEQRKIKRLAAQQKFFAGLVAEMCKPPKPYKPPKLTKRQRRQLEKMRRMAVPTGAYPVAIPQ